MKSSVEIREEGNVYYKCAGVAGLAPVLQQERYTKALKCYNHAAQLASNEDDMASALKNIAGASYRIGYVSANRMQEKRQTIAYYYGEAIKNFNLAFYRGESCKTDVWRTNIVATLGVCLEEAIAWSESLQTYMDKLRVLEFLGRDLKIPHVAVEYQLQIGKLIFHDGSTKLQNSDYKGCLSRMKDCYFHLEEAKRLGRSALDDADRNQEIGVLQQDVYYQTTTAESIQAREHGRQLLDVAIKQEEELNIELIWDVVDWFKQSTIFARELDLEQEAISLSCLGVLYDKVLKLQSKAKTYFMRTLQLADSLKPRTFTTEEWYNDAVTTLKRYQDEIRDKEEEQKRKETEGILKELENELKDLDNNNTGKLEFLKFVYTKYPPKDKKWNKPCDKDMEGWISLEHSKMKSLLQKGVVVYHPDKVDPEEHGKKWKVLSEEITKRLTVHYETMK